MMNVLILNKDGWGDLECLYKARQAAITDGGLFADTGVNEWGENEWQNENDNEMIDYCGTARRVDLWEIEYGGR